MTKSQSIIGGVLAAIAIFVLGAYAVLSTQHTLGAVPVNSYEDGVKWFGNGIYAGLNQQFGVDNAGVVTYSTSTQNGLKTVITAVSCVANSAATSTQFAQANPFAATSTATFKYLNAVGQATTTTLLVGTSTATTGRTSSNVSATFINLSIATSSVVFTAPGVNVGPGTGYTTSGTGTFRTVVVGPTEAVVATATSTAGGAGAAGYTPGLTSCSGYIEWQR